METIGCHDCGRPVSFSAKHCPNCGSTEPSGPYQMSRKEARRLRAEDRTDRSLAMGILVCASLGGLYGFAQSASVLGATLLVSFYGGIGVLVGAPVGFVVGLIVNTSAPRRR